MSRTLPQKYAPMSITDNDSEEFIATATPVGALSTTVNCVLEVIAPATLPQGYTFEVEAYGKTVKVTVTTGGVEEGEKFSLQCGHRVFSTSFLRPCGALEGQLTDSYYIAHYIVSQWLLVYMVLLIWLLCKTHGHIRNKYKIPSAHGCEDCCCAFWCTCCTVAQMAWHTGDYETYQGMCCSETGLPPDAPSIV
eukprot:CCRYP_006066-RA/>CCRYP_006066-RA protein AED:0.38 eAED:0.37 QI:0/0/0/1/0.33/0.25/4/0/192